MKTRSAAVLLAALILVGCAESDAKKAKKESFTSGATSTETAVRRAVLSSLKDPDSAKFGKFSEAGPSGACLTVNSRNSFGGYTGDQQAMLLKEGGQWHLISIFDISHSFCVEQAKDKIRY